MVRLVIALLLGFSLVSSAHAAESLSAGFAPTNIWVSDESPTEGDTVEIFTVIYDSSETPLEGSVTFLVDDVSIGSLPFSVDEGQSKIRSMNWKAVAGAHTITAYLETTIHAETKQEASVAHTRTSTTTISVLPKPVKESPAVHISSSTTNVVSSVLTNPTLSQFIAPVYNITERIRSGGINTLSTYAGTTHTSSADDQGTVLGTSTEEEVAAEATNSATPNSIVATGARTVLPLFTQPALFYPILVALLGFVFWLIAKRLRNPTRRRRS